MIEKRSIQIHEKEFIGDTHNYKIVEAEIGIFESYGIKSSKSADGIWITNSSVLVRVQGKIKNVPLELISFI